MADTKNNALAELAETMSTPVEPAPVNARGLIVLSRNQFEAYQKAGHIVAELAKVEYLTCDGAVISTVLTQADRAIIRCREIAEGGAGDVA